MVGNAQRPSLPLLMVSMRMATRGPSPPIPFIHMVSKRSSSSSSNNNNVAYSTSIPKSLVIIRRELMVKGGMGLLPALLQHPHSAAAREVEVGSYLPPSPSHPSFVLFKASPTDTPALRAGISFSLIVSS